MMMSASREIGLRGNEQLPISTWQKLTASAAGKAKPAAHLVRENMSKTEEGLMVSSEHTPASELRDPFLIGINMAFRAEVLTRLGGFDEEVGPGVHCGMCEDVLFSLQFKEAGFRIITAMKVVVEHHFDPKRLSHEGVLYRPVVEGRGLPPISVTTGNTAGSACRASCCGNISGTQWKRLTRKGELLTPWPARIGKLIWYATWNSTNNI